jgi:hypothetical protein
MPANRRRNVGVDILYYIGGLRCRVNYTEKSKLLTAFAKHEAGEIWIHTVTDPLTSAPYWEETEPGDLKQSWQALIAEFD